MRRISIVLIVLALLVGSLALFLLFNFQAVRGVANTEKQSSTYASRIEAGQSLPGGVSQAAIYVESKGRLSRALAETLPDALAADPAFGDVRRIDQRLERSDTALVYLVVTERNFFWTPVYAQASVDVDLYFASDGDLNWIEADVVHFSSGEPAVRKDSDLSLHDRVYGLISYPAYVDRLTQVLTEQAVDTLNQAVEHPAG